MRQYLSVTLFIASTFLLTSCHVDPAMTPADAYLGKYDCTLINKTARLAGGNELVETKTYSGSMVKTGETSLELNLTPLKDGGELTIPVMLTGESVVVPQFETASSYTSAGTTTYLSNYYSGNGKLENKTLSIALNSANYSIVGANGNQAQISNSDVACTCLKK